MYLISDLEKQVIAIPYSQGYRHLRVLSGYVSPFYVERILNTYKELHLEITVGMISVDGLSIWHHHYFLNLVNRFHDRLEINYHIKRPGNHRKVYYWNESSYKEIVFVGSANFTLNGFGGQQEILVESTFANIEEAFGGLSLISCDNPDVEDHVSFYSVSPRRIEVPTTNMTNEDYGHEIEDSSLVSEAINTIANLYGEYVDLSLIDRTGEVPKRSGLNWGQRDKRNRNQAYIPVPQSVHKADSTFFPHSAMPFLILTDDGEHLVCVMAQQKRKAIETHENNSILGAYFRRRLGLENGAFIKVADLRRYGRDSVRIYRIDDETYYLDFSV
ncbi:restriction endonuclease PLD domain-containing protein [Exiguobacterium sp. s140]|uniref:restriction endonuclease PLD domain-containing protein n=1 Tax=Exiguobacterium sp. s140 TaxID=2751290 RepID=UPI001BEC0472|nr:restriction endonuclease PLD domain-containing protein [Exiguobacterium sp. s140]